MRKDDHETSEPVVPEADDPLLEIDEATGEITFKVPVMSLIPGIGVKLTREGLSHLFKRLVFADGQSRTHDQLVKALEAEVEQARPVAESVPGFLEYAVDPEGNADFLHDLTKLPDSSPEKWATAYYLHAGGLFEEGTSLDEKTRQVMLWLVAKFRTMYLFTKDVQDLAWRGYLNHGVDVIEQALTAWEASDKDESEEHWQQFLQEQPYLINLIFPGPVAVHQGKAYLGGKKIDNTGGQIVDFLLEHSIGGSAALLEIKRPSTKLLMKTPYRGSEILTPSSELVGSVSQILNYRDTVVTQNNSSLNVFMPTCVVLAGNYADELDSDGKKRSFELYRTSLNGVSIVTYDELFDRLRKILDVLRGN
ncbi:Shedu immune nuclease family protein [Mycobacteroides chelonae]|nr:Shedu immune nuclease family protein [Mycobacteroides chelonae]